MTTALYLEHYLDSLEHLPIELQRNFTLLRDLDARAQNLMKSIDKLATEYLEGLAFPTNKSSSTSSDKKKELISNIQKMFNKAKEYGDDKVQLAIQTYELVDKHIRRLDSDLARFEAEIQEKAAAGSTRSVEETPGNKSKAGRSKKTKEKDKKRSTRDSSDDEATKSRKKQKRGGSKAQAAKVSEAAITTPLTHPSDVLDMPVDPNEPTYCLCHQVSYGEMIACEYPDCPIEWFHFACVNLTTKPKGKWYCPKCIEERKKK
ncbi:inhibitor of growth protein 4 [Neocloeon triangulifer]|uniref:inhibitor of growth protein 4 n=1 Tax=Neocloeon triangulifer TaxID=2078957 RepID=UPI00286F09E4|nr:inhibitor of growth protein 4 [Neocloeon triangulifer]